VYEVYVPVKHCHASTEFQAEVQILGETLVELLFFNKVVTTAGLLPQKY